MTTRPPIDRTGIRSRVSAVTLTVLAVWLATVVMPPVAFVAWRERRLAEIDRPEAIAHWEAFRDDMRRQSAGAGPVRRKVPKSAEPPELVWLRDHLALAIVAWVTLVGVLGGFLALATIGVARGGSAAQNRATGHGDDEKQQHRDAQHSDERRHG